MHYTIAVNTVVIQQKAAAGGGAAEEVAVVVARASQARQAKRISVVEERAEKLDFALTRVQKKVSDASISRQLEKRDILGGLLRLCKFSRSSSRRNTTLSLV